MDIELNVSVSVNDDKQSIFNKSVVGKQESEEVPKIDESKKVSHL